MLYSQKYREMFGLKKPEPEQPTPPDAEPTVAVPRSLTIINEGNSPDELAILPTIGKGAGKVILSDRPEGGYSSLSELPAKIFKPPYNCDMTEIENYSGE
jgi:hypothetical protein